MFLALTLVLAVFTLADAYLSAAVIYHLSRYTLPTWRAARLVVSLYLALSLIFFGFALVALFQIRG